MSAPDPMADTDPRTEIRTPPGVNRSALLRPLRHSAWADPRGGEYRREVTRYDPLAFALTYLSDHLRARETGWLTSFSPMHVHFAARAFRWAATSPGPIREADIAPRFSAKSTWRFLILPLWALAHGHRRYVMAFADASGQAEAHLATLRDALDRHPLLIQDFPELRPAGTHGARNTTKDLWFAGGGAMSARGMDARALGAKVGSERPDLILGDDLEPGAASYSKAAKHKRLATLLYDVLPMNDQAIVQLCGTVTMHGSIMHDLAMAALGEGEPAEWIAQESFQPHYFPPIIRDPDGSERSCWPERWSLDELRRKRALGGQGWALAFTNRPPRPGDRSVGWKPALFVHKSPPVNGRELFVDTATTTKKRSDFTAIAAMGLTMDRRRVVVAYCAQVKLDPGAVRAEIHRLCRNPANAITKVTVEGQETWRTILEPMPDGVELVIVSASTPKRLRHLDLLDLYGRAMVLHAGALGELETQMLEFPDCEHDDMIDTIALGAGTLLEGTVRL